MTHPYRNLAAQAAVGGLVMYLVMFAMIDGPAAFFNNLNTFYMALMMAAPMVAIMIVAMPSMYPSRRANIAIIGLSLGVTLIAFGAIRAQAGIGDRQFLRSMIPHHSGAILMCREAQLRDAEIRELCQGIIAGQRAEIEQMEAILDRR